MLLRPRQILAPVLFATVFGYFGYHLVNGDRGLLAMAHLQREVQVANQNLAEAETTQPEIFTAFVISPSPKILMTGFLPETWLIAPFAMRIVGVIESLAANNSSINPTFTTFLSF